MEIEIQLTGSPIAETISPPPGSGAQGAWLEFRGVVRGEENGRAISALEYEAYPEMAAREIRRLLADISQRRPCLAAKVIHRVGAIRVGETAIYIGVAGRHRREAIELLAEFLDRLKKDVPIWKRRALPAETKAKAKAVSANQAPASAELSPDAAISEIQSRCQPLPPVRVALSDGAGRVLRETVCAPEDFPDCDRSTRDGFAILQNDGSAQFQIVDTMHAADWKPRELKTGQTVRVATGAPLPCEHLRVVMQEDVERNRDEIKILKRDGALNLRRRGEDVTAGTPLVTAGARLDAGKLALLASAGCAQPLVSPRLRICHFTTGDEIVPPGQTPGPGQIRDSNSALIRGLLQKFSCDVTQKHLPEDFAAARRLIETFDLQPSTCNLLLVSGGASVGEKDFTRELLAWLGFEIIFSRVNVRPGRPLIFGWNGNSAAFGLPGNPLSHFVCFHRFIAGALAQLTGQAAPALLRGKLAEEMAEAPCPRETLWPARVEFANGELQLRPLKWSSSGDATCLAEANSLIRIPANHGPLPANATVDFLPAAGMMEA